MENIKSKTLELIKQYQKTKKNKHLDEILNLNQRLLTKIVKSYFLNNDLEFDDLYQEASIGLIKAVKKYNLKKYKINNFFTYAIYWIKSYILDFVKANIIKANMKNYIYSSNIYRISKIKQDLEMKIKSDSEICKKYNLTLKNLKIIKSYIYLKMFSKDDINNDNSNIFLSNDDTNLDKMENKLNLDFEKGQIKKIIENKLTKRQKYIIIEYYYNGKTLEKIGKEINISRERVRQIKIISLKILKKNLSYKGKLDE